MKITNRYLKQLIKEEIEKTDLEKFIKGLEAYKGSAAHKQNPKELETISPFLDNIKNNQDVQTNLIDLYKNLARLRRDKILSVKTIDLVLSVLNNTNL